MNIARVIKGTVSLALVLGLGLSASAAIYVGAGDNVWRVDDNLTGIVATQSGFGAVRAIATQPNGGVLVGVDNALQRWNYLLDTKTGSANFGGSVSAIDVWPDNTVGAAASGGDVVRMDPTISTTLAITGGAGAPAGLAVQPDGSFVVAGAAGIVFHLDINITSSRITGGYGTLAGIDNTSDGHSVIGGSALNMVWKLDPTDTFFAASTGGFPGLTTVKVGPDDSIYVGCSGDTIYRLDTGLAAILGSQTGVGSITASAIMWDGTVLFGNAAGKVFRYDPSLSYIIGEYDFGAPISALAGDVVPEPASLTALASAMAGLMGITWRRRR